MSEIESRDLRMYGGFGGAALLLLGALGFALSSVSKLAGTLDQNVETYEAIHAVHGARSAVEMMVAGFGGYMFSGSEEAFDLMVEGEHAFDESLSRAAALVGTDPGQQALLADARRINDEWRVRNREPALQNAGMNPVEVAAAEGTNLEHVLEEQQEFQRYLGEVYARIDAFLEVEYERLEERARSVGWFKQTALWLIGLGGLVGLTAAGAFTLVGIRRSRALVAANRSLRQEVLERQRAESALERASRRNSLILEAAGEGICGLDREGRVIFLNPAAAEMLGVREGEAMYRPFAAVVHSREAATDGGESPLAGFPTSVDEAQTRYRAVDTFRRSNGTSFPVEYITRPIVEGGEVTGTVLTFQDITERRAVEKLKDEFVAVVSHELRTPLTSIRGSLGLLASGMLGTLEERGQRMLAIAAQNTDRLVRLINDILDIERIESGMVVMQPRATEADHLIELAIESVQGVAEKAGVQIDAWGASATVWADPDRVVQVLTNLLSNAIKFSERGSDVTLTTQRESGMLRFSVADRGRGIPRGKLRSIFGRFQQVDASDSREKGGTGLGLAIARSIVLQHGGEIWVESERGVGSVFHFTLPLRAATDKARRDRISPTVLLCDDDEITREVVGEQLRAQGYRVLTAADGRSAVDLASREQPDAILLDLVMPEMNGCETMVELKGQPQTADVPIVIFSSTPRGAAAPELDGASGRVTKSAGKETLFRALERAICRSPGFHRILLVEDDLDLAEVMITMFETHGLEACHADNYTDAMRLARSCSPDLLIMDIVLREGDAFELVDGLRRDDRLRSVPLVVYSALDLDDTQRDRLRLGPTEFFTKGRMSPSEFERRIVALMDELFHPTPAGV